MTTLDTTTDGPEGAVLASLTNEALLAALSELPTEQRDCLVMRFLQGLSIAETAEVLDRSAGAVKQLQLRGVRNLAKILPRGPDEPRARVARGARWCRPPRGQLRVRHNLAETPSRWGGCQSARRSVAPPLGDTTRPLRSQECTDDIPPPLAASG